MYRTQTLRTLSFGLLFFFGVLMISPARAIENKENSDTRALLNRAAQEAYALDYDADQMRSLLYNEVGWQTHAQLLEEIKTHVNNLGKITAQLEARRNQASQWQQTAIDRAIPLLRELAANTTSAINHLSRNEVRPVSGDYPEYLEANADTAHELARMIGATVEYGHTRDKLQQLQQRLQIASK